MNKTDKRIEQLTKDLHKLQFEQNQILFELNSLTQKKRVNASPTKNGPITVGSWVSITNNYENEKGLAGKVHRITPKTVVFITKRGERRRLLKNVELIETPRGAD